MPTAYKTKGRAKRFPLLHVADLAFNTPLAVIPEKLDAILRGVGPRLVSNHVGLQEFLDSGALVGTTPAPVAYWDDEDDEDNNGEPTRPYSLVNGVAVIPVSGTLMDTGGWMSALSGCSSYEGITKALKMAMENDASVNAVMFKVNSPGGSTNGCFELCDLIHSYRGKKPMYAVAKHLAASAAYAIASSADKVFVSLTGGVGSVGVFALHCDQSGMDKEVGLAYKYIKFGAKKTDGNPHEPLSASAESDLQAEVDRQGEMFVARIARNRGVSKKKILDTEAAVFCGEEALPLLADSVSTYDEALAELTRKGLDFGATLRTSQRNAEVTQPALNASTNEPDEDDDDMTPCEKCNGTGKVDDAACSACNGTGKASAAVVTAPVSATINTGTPLNTSAVDLAVAAQPVQPAQPAQPLAAQPAPQPLPIPSAKESATMDAVQLLAIQDEIKDICAIAGVDASTTLAFLMKKDVTVEEVKKDLRARREVASSSNPTNPGFGVGAGTGDPLMSLFNQFQVARANTAAVGMRPSQLLEATIRSNPALYDAYNDQREVAALTTAGRREYSASLGSKFQSMGLSPVRG